MRRLCVAAGSMRRRSLGAAAATGSEGHRALVVDPCTPQLLERLAACGCQVSQRAEDETPSQALRRAKPEIVIVRSSQLQAAQLQEAGGVGDLGLVMRAGAGVDNIAVDALVRQGVQVANAAGANAVAVAELTMAHLLNLDRRLYDQVASLRRGEWRRLEFARGARGLQGSTLAVLGIGYIGREVVKRALAFGMRVKAWSRSLTPEAALALGCVFCASPTEAASGADALAVHLPLCDETQGLVGEALLGRLAPGALVVNMSRGGVVDEAALLREVRDRGLRAGLDVFAAEPPAGVQCFEDEALRECTHVYGTHHTGARTAQAAQAVEDAVVRAVAAYLAGKPVPGAIGP